MKRVSIPRNFIIDKLIMPMSFDDLKTLQGVELFYLNVSSNDYEIWVRQYFPTWRSRFGHLHHKKVIEFFATFTLLEPSPDDVFLDAAGGIDTYLHNLECKKKYMQDMFISRDIKSRLGNRIEYVESDAGGIPLPRESVDKISCHHAFEHFQADSDISFIKEIQRLLRPNGKCCIIQTFIANHYVEVTNEFTFNKKFDDRSQLVVDPTATIPGGKRCGYARIYDLEAFQERVIGNINLSEFKITIAELRMDGDMVPDLTLNCNERITAINRPFRAMVIEKSKKVLSNDKTEA